MEPHNQVITCELFLNYRPKEELSQFINRLSWYISCFEEREIIIEEVFNDMVRDREKYREQMRLHEFFEEISKANHALKNVLEKKRLVEMRLRQVTNTLCASMAMKRIPCPDEQNYIELYLEKVVRFYCVDRKTNRQIGL